jgi:hypothetical protein
VPVIISTFVDEADIGAKYLLLCFDRGTRKDCPGDQIHPLELLRIVCVTLLVLVYFAYLSKLEWRVAFP